MLTKINTRDWLTIAGALRSREAFKTNGALHGEPVNGRLDLNYGRLHYDYYKSLEGAEYVVYSYLTPIAWYNPSEGYWFMPSDKYSLTTTKHQSTIRSAIWESEGN